MAVAKLGSQLPQCGKQPPFTSACANGQKYRHMPMNLATDPRPATMEQESTNSALDIWHAVSRCLAEITNSIEATSSRGQQEDKSSSTSWRHSGFRASRSYQRPQSFEWETDTRIGSSVVGTTAPFTQPFTQPWNQPSFPCPFRKRNPVRFNVRNHERCAKAPFSSLSELR